MTENAGPAAAEAPMRFTPEDRGPLKVLHADGAIESGSAERLAEALGTDVDEVWLSSSGGDMIEALRMGRALRDRRVVTRVAAGASCAGACAEAFLGGSGRLVDQGGRLGFTALPLSNPASVQTAAEREQAAAQWAEERADYYIRAGISRALLRLQLAVPAPGICYLTEDALRRYNVVNTTQN